MSQRQLHHLLDLRQLLPAAADVVIADLVQRLLLLLNTVQRGVINGRSDEEQDQNGLVSRLSGESGRFGDTQSLPRYD